MTSFSFIAFQEKLDSEDAVNSAVSLSYYPAMKKEELKSRINQPVIISISAGSEIIH